MEGSQSKLTDDDGFRNLLLDNFRHQPDECVSLLITTLANRPTISELLYKFRHQIECRNLIVQTVQFFKGSASAPVIAATSKPLPPPAISSDTGLHRIQRASNLFNFKKISSGLFSPPGSSRKRKSTERLPWVEEEPLKPKQSCDKTSFIRDFILLKHKEAPTNIVSDDEYKKLGEKGYVYQGIRLAKNMSENDIKEKLYDECTLLPRSIDFTIYNTKGKKVIRYYTSKNCEVNGEFLLTHSSQKNFLYIVPHEDLDSSFDGVEDLDQDIETYSEISSEICRPKKLKKDSLNSETESWTEVAFLNDTIHSFRQNITRENRTVICINRKESILPQIIKVMERTDFSITAVPLVSFQGEVAVGKGPTRDMFQKALAEIRDSPLLEGPPNKKTFKKCKPYVENGTLEHYGCICAWSIMHGGPAPTFFSHVFVAILLKGCAEARQLSLKCDDVANEMVKREIQSVLEAESTAFAINSRMADASIFDAAGTHTQVMGSGIEAQRAAAVKVYLCVSHPNLVSSSCISKRHFIRNTTLGNLERGYLDVLQFYMVDRIEAEVAAFGAGLNQFDLLTFLKLHPSGAEALFKESNRKLATKDDFLGEFLIATSVKESHVYPLFLMYLDRAESTNRRFSLSQIFEWITGLSSIPSLGYGDDIPTISIDDIAAPRVRSCFRRLYLPSQLTTYDEVEMAFDCNLDDIQFTEP